MANSSFSPTVLTIPSAAGGTGQGELNLVTNPVAASDLSGWTGAGRGTSGGPLNPTITTYFTVLNTAGLESFTSGAYDVLSLPSGLQNKKLKVEFYFTSPALDTFKVSVYKGTTRVPLTTDVSGSTALPQSTTGKFVAYFDTDSSGTWTVSITRTAGTGSTALQFTNVVVGPGIQPQGAVVGEWQSYTPVLTATTTNPTVSGPSGKWRRVGSSAEVDIALTITAAGSGTYTLSLPAGLTVDYTAMGSITTDYGIGRGNGYVVTNAAATRIEVVPGFNSSGVFNNKIIVYKYNSSVLTSTDITGASSTISTFVTVPIAEWAGSGTVQLAQNDVEYAYNTSTSTTTNDTTSFGYGPQGALIQNITTVGGLDRTVQFQTPIQAGDVITVEMQSSSAGASWIPVGRYAGVDFNFANQNGTTYGVGLFTTNVSNNQVVVRFGQYAYNLSTYGAAGQPWSTSGGNYRWRVRKSSAGAAVGFGIVAPGVSSGLVSASGLPGNTSGSPIASGYVGETKQVFNTSTISSSADTWTYINALSNITKGIWLIGYSAPISDTTGVTGVYGRVIKVTQNADTGDVANSFIYSLGPATGTQVLSKQFVYYATADLTSIELRFKTAAAGAMIAGPNATTAMTAEDSQTVFYAIRIA